MTRAEQEGLSTSDCVNVNCTDRHLRRPQKVSYSKEALTN